MKKKLLLLILPSFFMTRICFSQDEPPVISISAGTGIFTFNGDVGTGAGVTAYTYLRSGYSLNAEKRFKKNWLGASLDIVTGKLAMAERSTDVAHNNNFQSSVNQFGLNLTGYLLNKKNIPIVPYFTTGLAYATLKTYTDIKFGDSLYYYWNDGTIRNLPQLPANETKAHEVKRDYTYETPLAGAAKSAMSIPVGIGLKMKISKSVEANIGATFHLTFTDEIDAIKKGGNDNYLYSYFSLTYNIIKRSKETKEASSVDFSSIDNLDLDGDGVNDNRDKCPDTPKGVKVDSKGCPIDSDGDGVPDYLDKEPNTKKGSVVDSDGRTITDAMMQEKYVHDSLTKEWSTTFKNTPSASSLKQIDKQIKSSKQKTGANSSKIPAQFSSADINHDGIISSSEITAVIDGFFDGSNNYTMEKINSLIEYFFEQ